MLTYTIVISSIDEGTALMWMESVVAKTPTQAARVGRLKFNEACDTCEIDDLIVMLGDHHALPYDRSNTP